MAEILNNAAEMDITLEHVEMKPRAWRDDRGMRGVEGAPPPCFQEVVFEVYVESTADERRVAEMISKAEKRN